MRISAPTDVATIVGRFACDGPDDLPRVAAPQADLTLQPLGDGALAGIPQPGDDVPEALRFWEQLRLWMRAFPPAPDDQAYARRFVSLGLLDDAPVTALETATTAALAEGLAAGQDRVEQATRAGRVTPVDGWLVGLHTFDYNLDHFEVGAIDDPMWKIADRTASYLARAAAARFGLWGNHAYEAVYAQVFTDAAGDPLDGSRRYTIRFAALPPVDGFWSLTMYDVPDYYLVDNAIDRYSIGDRTPGLQYAEDGSLTLLVQHDPPADEQRANWLPAPAGAFRPMMRLYEPRAAVLDGDYHLPPLVRVDDATSP